MPDVPEISDTVPDPTPHEPPGTPTDETPAAPAAAGAQAPRPRPSVADTARLLATHFPALFGADVIKPIKLRIQADIHQRAPGVFTKAALSIFLQRHTTSTAYLRALVAQGATRTDLDGAPAGDIAAEHRDAAVAELDRRRAIVDARKQAERAAARADRSAKPSQPGQAPRRSRPPQPGAQRGTARPGDTGPGAPRRPREPRPEREPVRAHEQRPVKAPAPQLTPEQAAEAEARQQRALLLRSFEQSPLAKSNFAALKGMTEAALDALLTLARQDRGSR